MGTRLPFFVAEVDMGTGAGKGAPQQKRVTARRCRDEVRQLVLESMPEVARGLIGKAKDGSYNQAKLLVELGGLMDADAEPGRRGKTSLARVLMRELRRREAESQTDESEKP